MSVLPMFDRIAARHLGQLDCPLVNLRIVQRYGGRMWVESVAGEGSTFRFSFPVPESTPRADQDMIREERNSA